MRKFFINKWLYKMMIYYSYMESMDWSSTWNCWFWWWWISKYVMCWIWSCINTSYIITRNSFWSESNFASNWWNLVGYPTIFYVYYFSFFFSVNHGYLKLVMFFFFLISFQINDCNLIWCESFFFFNYPSICKENTNTFYSIILWFPLFMCVFPNIRKILWVNPILLL